MPTDAATRVHRAALSSWLNEWRLEQCLRAAPAGILPCPATPASRFELAPGLTTRRIAQVPPLVAGAIHLFRPRPQTAPTLHRPFYVVVFPCNRGTDWQVIPFGRFATPAIPGEWRTGLRTGPLRVLCFWNQRHLAAGRLRALTWRAGRLPPGLDACVCRHARESNSRTEDLSRPACSARFGPPLAHPLDPRWTYLQEETDALDDTIDDDAAPDVAVRMTDRYPNAWDEPHLKAAEDHPPYRMEDR